MRIPKPREIIEDVDTRDKVLSDMRARIGVDTKREGIHLSSLVFCLRKAWHMYRIDQSDKSRAEVLGTTPDETALVWVIGHSHEAIFGTSSIRGESTEKDGITYTPDFWRPEKGKLELVEMKSTRKSANKGIEDMEHYMAQAAGYCAASGLTECCVFVLHLMGDYDRSHPPQAMLKVWRLKFTKKELKDWWDELKRRRNIIIGCIEAIELDDKSPMYEWECGYCQVRDLIGCPGGYEYQQAAQRAARKKQEQSL
jgi:hypothetical protein